MTIKTNMIDHLYVHVPFCKSICSYCDFCHRVYDSGLIAKWLKQLEYEIKDKCHNQYSTIYIGGGTPSCLSYGELKSLLDLIKPFSNNVDEYTIEINPETIDLDKIRLFKQYGINRISIGVQSSNEEELKLLNRHHNFEDIRSIVKDFKDNDIYNISIDLMYSLPNQSINSLKNTLNDFKLLDVPHISIYSLTIEENTLFGKLGYKSLDNEIEADMYEYINHFLSNNGYFQYEVSNYCKKGYESKHNLGYWNYEDYLGISLSSTSKIGNHRYTNTYKFDEYLNDFNNHFEDLLLDKKDLMFENIMMSLRTIYGLNIDDFNRKYDCNLCELYSKALTNKNVLIENGHLRCNYLAILNNVLLDFMD